MDLLPWMERWGMLPPKGGVLLCAVSGGRDSVCLLHYLAAIAPQRGFTVAAGHLNHQMRPEARRDEDFVRELCRTLGVAFYTEAAPVYETAARWGLGVEETGRRLRYEFLFRTADAIGADRIATAHHAQDQVADQAADCGRAERAPLPAADLRGDADRVAVLIVHDDSLDGVAVAELPEIFDRPVNGRHLLAQHLEL